MTYGHNQQFKILQYTAAAVPCKINEGAHQQHIKNVVDYSYYALLATESTNNVFKIETHKIHLMARIIKQQNT